MGAPSSYLSITSPMGKMPFSDDVNKTFIYKKGREEERKERRKEGKKEGKKEGTKK